MQLGFETVGNATLIVHDRVPILATDPWLDGHAYFGSWRLSHSVPDEQRRAVQLCPYIWLSHGHPDHMHMPSLATLRDSVVLLPDHVGGRIRDYLIAEGYRVEVLADRRWRRLSDHVRICAIADVNQDALLLVDIDGTLVINANDAHERGWAPTVRRASRRRDAPTFLLALSGYGDADMINYFDEDGQRIEPWAARRGPLGPSIAARMSRLGARYFIPFASHHCYQRADSVWANEYTTPVSEHRIGFESASGEILPAFVRYDCRTDSIETIDPPAPPIEVHDPLEFGDSWAEPLTPTDVALAQDYFARITTLRDALDAVVLDVGGEQHRIAVGTGTGRSVTFTAPRSSLVSAMQWEIFDDLLIGNFIRTTLHGDWPGASLNPLFTARVAKYADNGRARTPTELQRYLAQYRRRAPLAYMRFEAATRAQAGLRTAARAVRARVHEGSASHRLGRRAYRAVRRG